MRFLQAGILYRVFRPGTTVLIISFSPYLMTETALFINEDGLDSHRHTITTSGKNSHLPAMGAE